jgi:hypothetical protein
MNPFKKFILPAAAALAFAASIAHADSSSMTNVPTWLAGTWTLVRCDNVYPDGHRVELYGPHPQGMWMIDAQGHYMMHIARMQRTPFASGDKSKGTPEEYRAASMDSNSHFGSVQVQGDKMTTHIEQASFPNWNGHGGTTGYTRSGNQLTYVVAKPSSGAAEGAHGEVVWQKLDNG